MKYEEAKKHIRALLPEYLEAKGININKNFNCLNPAHDDNNPSMSFDRERLHCHCFACGAKYDTFDLIGIDYNLPEFKDQLRKACELYHISIDRKTDQNRDQSGNRNQIRNQSADGKPEKDYSGFIRTAAGQLDGSPAEAYLHSRGISTETAARFACGYDPEGNALIIPTGDMIHSLTARNLNPDAKGNNRYRNRGNLAVFNARAIKETKGKPLFIVEGEIDALSIIEAGGEAAAIGGANGINAFINVLKQTRPETDLYLAMDQDKPGQEAEKKLSEELARLKIKHFRINPYGRAKDANEALQADRDGFTYRIRNAEQHIRDQIRAEYFTRTRTTELFPAFLEDIQQSKYNRPISTGFRKLDEILDGGLRRGLYVIGAISSLGKTTFCLQIADQIAESGTDVMIFSLEMSRNELIGKSISRNTLQIAMKETGRRDYAKTFWEIMDGSKYKDYSEKDLNRIRQAEEKYASYSDHVFIHEGIGKISVNDIAEAVREHKEVTGNYPVVFIDYLQILKPEDPHFSDKQNADSNITALRQMARELPIITVSSLNRESYKTGGKNNGRVSITDLKESGGIEYGADVVLGLQFSSAGEIETDEKGKMINAYNEQEAKKQDPRYITSVTLKNRNGAVYRECEFTYIPRFNCFHEL